MENKDLKNSIVENSDKESTVNANGSENTLNGNEIKLNEVKTPQNGEAKKSTAADAILQRLANSKNQGEKKPDEEILTEQVKQPVNEKQEQVEIKTETQPIIESTSEPHKKEKKIIAKNETETEANNDDIISSYHSTSEEDLQKLAEIEKIDFLNSSKEEMVATIKDLIEYKNPEVVKQIIDDIRAVFYKKYNAEKAEAKKEFEKINTPDAEPKAEQPEFRYEDPLEIELKKYYQEFRDKRQAFNEKIEQEKKNNLDRKYQIINELKELINTQDPMSDTFNEFRNLQLKWREIGLVPQSEVKSLWETYNHHVENFYNYVKINKELRDLDLKKNLQTKIEICEKAEELLLESNIVVAFRTLQRYHDEWRETGPVPHEKKDEIWERFKEATTKINKAHQDYFESIKEEQLNNLNAKTLLCEKAEELTEKEITTPKEWEAKSNELIELQKVWKVIGFAPKKDNTKIYERFRAACDKFFEHKRLYFSRHKDDQINNLQLKTDLCLQAESLKESTDWRKTTEIYINLQEQWKTIGPVPRKQSDIIWNRFRTACNYFFDKKAEHFSSIDKEQDYNLQLKTALIEEIMAYEFSESNDDNLEKLKEFQSRWTEIGHVPFNKKDEIQKQYRELINKRFDELRSVNAKGAEVRFKSRVETMQTSPKGKSKLKQERDRITSKLQEIKSDIDLLENNIGFFAKSKNAESLIEEVKKKIAKNKTLSQELREQLKVLDIAESKIEKTNEEKA